MTVAAFSAHASPVLSDHSNVTEITERDADRPCESHVRWHRYCFAKTLKNELQVEFIRDGAGRNIQPGLTKWQGFELGTQSFNIGMDKLEVKLNREGDALDFWWRGCRWNTATGVGCEMITVKMGGWDPREIFVRKCWKGAKGSVRVNSTRLLHILTWAGFYDGRPFQMLASRLLY